MTDHRGSGRLGPAIGAVRARGRLPLLLVVALLVGLQGASLTQERWGLDAEYRSQADGVGHVLGSEVDEEPSIRRDTARLPQRSEYSVRWTGWVWIEESGRYFFSSRSSGRSYVEVRGERVVENEGGAPPQSVTGRLHLRRGLHPIEIGFSKTPGRWHLIETVSGRKINRLAPLSPASLFDTHPGRYRLLVRKATLGLSMNGRRVLGGAMILAALLLVWLAVRPHWQVLRSAWRSFRARISEPHLERRWRVAFLLALFAVAFFASIPFTGSPYGYDDLLYMRASGATEPIPWILNRYAHIYILKAFIGLQGGDAFRGSELFWSFAFGVTVAAMGAAVMSLGKGFQILTLLVSLLLLMSQQMLFDRLGAAYSDYTAMMFVTVGVAVYLHGCAKARDSTWRWAAFALGLLTFWAFKSKELGAVLLWLVPLLALEKGRLDWGKFARRSAFWLGGAAVGLAALMTLDAAFYGDALLSVRPEYIKRVGTFNFANYPESHDGWIATLWRGHPIANPKDASAGILGIFVLLAAAAATLKGKALELRLLHLMPVAYLAALILMHLRATYAYLPRYLYPITPVACVLAAALFHYAGLDDLDWRKFTSWRFLAPALLVCATPFAVWKLVPFERLAQAGWSAGDLVARVVTPLVLLALLSLFCAFYRHRAARLALMLIVTAVVFAPYLNWTTSRLVKRSAVHKAQNFLYPLRSFEAELKETKVRHIRVSQSLLAARMCGGYQLACKRIVKLFLGPDVHVSIGADYDPIPAFTLASRADVEGWERTLPDLRSRVTFDSAHSIALIRSPNLPLPESVWTRAIPR